MNYGLLNNSASTTVVNGEYTWQKNNMEKMMRHRATTRYKNGGKHRGKTISQSEINRRIAQSFGYKHSINPELIGDKGSNAPSVPTQSFENPHIVDTETIKL
jgi:hypothetical protein